MTNNFDNIKKILEFSEKNDFYYIMILQRRKENPDMKIGVRNIDNLYLYSIDDLDKIKNRIIETCEKYNARAYINLNRLDMEKIALYTQKKIIDLIIQGEFKYIKNAYASVCGSHTTEKTKKWVIDIDENELKYKDNIVNLISNLHTLNNKKYKIIAELPSKSGIHIISNPFDLKIFNDEINKLGIKIDVKKNSPTILYCT